MGRTELAVLLASFLPVLGGCVRAGFDGAIRDLPPDVSIDDVSIQDGAPPDRVPDSPGDQGHGGLCDGFTGILCEDPWTGQKVSLDGESGDRFQINVTTAQANKSSPAGALPRGAWACLEMFVDVSDTGSAWVQVDGTRLAVQGDTLPASGRFNRLLVGLSSNGQAISADFDNLRVGDQVYGCSDHPG